MKKIIVSVRKARKREKILGLMDFGTLEKKISLMANFKIGASSPIILYHV